MTVYKVILLIISNITNIHHVQTNIIVLLVLMNDIIAVQCLTHKFKVILFVLLITVVELIEIIFSTYDIIENMAVFSIEFVLINVELAEYQ